MEYIAKRGDTLNSIANSLGFSNYKDAGISSVPSGNFDLIRPGDVITYGASKPIATVTPTETYKNGIVPPTTSTVPAQNNLIDVLPTGGTYGSNGQYTDKSGNVYDRVESGVGTSNYKTQYRLIQPAPINTNLGTTIPTTEARPIFDYETYKADLAKQQADLDLQKEVQRKAIIDTITNKYTSRATDINRLGEEELARSRSLNLRSGLIDSPLGDTEIGKTKGRTAEALKANEAAKADEIMANMAALDDRYYNRKRDLTTDKLNELKTAGDLRTASIAEKEQRRAPVATILQSLAKKGITFDKFKLDPRYNDVKNDFTDNELEALFLSNTPSNTLLSDKPEIHGSKAFWFQKQPDGTIKTITVDLGTSDIKDVVKTDSGIYVINSDGTFKNIGGSTPTSSDEYKKALQFVKDNPNASQSELEQSIRSNTKGLSDAEIRSLTSKATNLTRESIAKLYGIEDSDVKTGGFLGIGGQTGKEKLDAIMKIIDQYRGTMSDAEILKQIQQQ